jgi:uncharacterized membrane protein YbaN (DUF454 family)
MLSSRPLRVLLVIAGTLSLALGIIGIFLPLLPTTPFLLLASACYVRGSERLHRWLLNQGRLGAYIRRYEEGQGIPLRGKVLAMLMMWPSIAYATTKVSPPVLKGLMVATALGVTVWIWRLPTWQAPRADDGPPR